jgi:hypothetical protein
MKASLNAIYATGESTDPSVFSAVTCSHLVKSILFSKIKSGNTEHICCIVPLAGAILADQTINAETKAILFTVVSDVTNDIQQERGIKDEKSPPLEIPTDTQAAGLTVQPQASDINLFGISSNLKYLLIIL